MKFQLDTEHYENILLDVREEEFGDAPDGVVGSIEEFCYALSCFFMLYSEQLHCDTAEKLTVLKEVCLDLVSRNIDAFLEEDAEEDLV